MKLTPEVRNNVQKILIIIVFYIIISWFIAYYNFALVFSPWTNGPSGEYSLKFFILGNTLVGFLAGSLGGSALVFVNSRYFRRRSFSFALIFTILAYSITFLIIALVVPTFVAIIRYSDEATLAKAMKFIYGPLVSDLLTANFLFWLGITLITQFILQINDKFGPGVLFKFITGKYYQPKEEQRIFMFMDMKSSTSVAERLGNKIYFRMLQEVIYDITIDISANHGEIYQYVGDEIVISWNIKTGIKDLNFLNCFLDIKKRLTTTAPLYQEKFGISPEFKAGVHSGLVTAGELGSIKKEIVYSGDVLNTASRIQDKCNELNSTFLVSERTFDLVKDEVELEIRKLKEVGLKGKEEKLNLISIV